MKMVFSSQDSPVLGAKKNWAGRISGSYAGFEQTADKVAIVQGDVQEEEDSGEDRGEHSISRLHDGNGSAEAQESFWDARKWWDLCDGEDDSSVSTPPHCLLGPAVELCD